MINFMLPTQIGAITIDGTWLIILGVIIVAGIIYKNRANISLKSSDNNINNDTNVLNETVLEETEDSISKTKNNQNVDIDEEVSNLEKEKLFN
ncbi:hypothetical protein [Methanosphaera sp.]|uniref:hypothetical protein n=1 Tax=Methanosphaera sp. TaxID=2666342 RepID=UPI002E76322F|nr:hypothetical protein [Methanosphaera sp.]MEE1117008.1 hypothetical protein [Methanosphaera sp.]